MSRCVDSRRRPGRPVRRTPSYQAAFDSFAVLAVVDLL